MIIGFFVMGLVLIYLVVTNKFAQMMQVLFGASGGGGSSAFSGGGSAGFR